MIPDQKQKSIKSAIKKHFNQYASTNKWSNLYKNEVDDRNINFYLRLKTFQKLLSKIKGKTIVDVGCGTGDYLSIIPEHYKEYLGLDFSKEMIKKAKKNKTNTKLNKSFRVFDINNHKIQKKFDVVIASGLIEYFTNHDEIIEKLLQLCKTGGRVIIQYPNKNFYRWKNKKYQKSPGKNFFHNRFSRKEVFEFFKNKTLIIEDLRYYALELIPHFSNAKLKLLASRFNLILPEVILNKLASNFVITIKK